MEVFGWISDDSKWNINNGVLNSKIVDVIHWPEVSRDLSS